MDVRTSGIAHSCSTDRAVSGKLEETLAEIGNILNCSRYLGVYATEWK